MTTLIIDMSNANEWYIEEVYTKLFGMGLKVRRIDDVEMLKRVVEAME